MTLTLPAPLADGTCSAAPAAVSRDAAVQVRRPHLADFALPSDTLA